MKCLQCEMCGSQDLVKEGGVFVCQSCGTKYSVEEAKKMMVEGTVSVEGTVAVEGVVKVDKSEELKNLLVLARRAKDDNKDFSQASEYYGDIALKDPKSWEANFYKPYCDALCDGPYTMLESLSNLSKYFDSTIALVVENYGKGQEAKTILNLIIKEIENISGYVINSKIEFEGKYWNPTEISLKLQLELGIRLAIMVPEMKDIIANAFKACLNTYVTYCVKEFHKSDIAYEWLSYVHGYEVARNIELILHFDPSFKDKWGFSDWIKNNPSKVFSDEDYFKKQVEINDLLEQQAMEKLAADPKKMKEWRKEQKEPSIERKQRREELITDMQQIVGWGGSIITFLVGGIWGLVIGSWAPVIWFGAIMALILVILYIVKYSNE